MDRVVYCSFGEFYKFLKLSYIAMNLSTSKLKKIFSFAHDRDPSKQEFNPYRDWKAILSLFCAGLVLVAALDAYVFFFMQGNNARDAAPVSPSAELNKKGLVDALTLYGEKTRNFNALMASRTESYKEIPDPSR